MDCGHHLYNRNFSDLSKKAQEVLIALCIHNAGAFFFSFSKNHCHWFTENLVHESSIIDDLVDKTCFIRHTSVWWHTSAPYMQDKLCRHATKLCWHATYLCLNTTYVCCHRTWLCQHNRQSSVDSASSVSLSSVRDIRVVPSDVNMHVA